MTPDPAPLKKPPALPGRGSRSWPYVAPFGAFLILLAIGPYLPGGAAVQYPLRVVLVTAVLLIWSRGVMGSWPTRWIASVLLGGGVFLIWVAPDLWFPGYRSHWLFQNALTGAVASSVPPQVRVDALFLLFRVGGSVILVPIIEELFWRAWLMRYLSSRCFEGLPLGSSTSGSFWITALLFASEHGPYWDVGLVASVAFNWWMVRTRSLADCILAHAVANACLAVYVIWGGHWQYWL